MQETICASNECPYKDVTHAHESDTNSPFFTIIFHAGKNAEDKPSCVVQLTYVANVTHHIGDDMGDSTKMSKEESAIALRKVMTEHDIFKTTAKRLISMLQDVADGK